MLEFEGSIRLVDLLPFIEEKLSAGIWRSDAAGQMLWSHGLYELLGLDPRTTTPSYAEIQRRIHPDDRDLTRGSGEPMINRSLLDGEFRIIRPNGALRWSYSQTEVLLDTSGKPECVLGVVVDITDERNLLESLKADAERYSALAQMAGGLLWIGSPDGRVTGLPNGRQPPEDRQFEEWMDLLHDEERESVLKEWAASVETGRPYNVEHQLRQPDGAYRWYRCRAVPLRDLDGVVREWLGICIDMHDEKLSARHVAASRLTGMQMRAARGMLNWSVKELAERTGISFAVIRRLEQYNDTPPMPDALMGILRDTFSDAGIEFLYPLVGKPGVRPR